MKELQHVKVEVCTAKIMEIAPSKKAGSIKNNCLNLKVKYRKIKILTP
jgi:hypothetical protein